MALSDLIQPRIAVLGKIKIGGLGESRTSDKGNTWRLPVKHDYFTVVSLHRNAKGDLAEDSDLMEQLKKQYADHDGKLRQLPVSLLSNEVEDVLEASWLWYIGKKRAAKSDGKTLWWYYDPSKKEWLDKPREEEWRQNLIDWQDSKGNRYFKLNSTFRCVISSKEAKWGGLYDFRTTSRITASQLYGSLLHLKELTGGILRGLPLRLVVRPLQVAPGGKVTTVYVVHIELVGPDLSAIQQLALDRMKCELANVRQLEEARREYRRLLLPPGEHESQVEQAEIAEEFYPEVPDEAQSEPPTTDPLADQLGLTGIESQSSNGEPGAAEDLIEGPPDPDVAARREAASMFREQMAGASLGALLKIKEDLSKQRESLGEVAYQELIEELEQHRIACLQRPAKPPAKPATAKR